jgi:hypothetical protein
MTEYLGVLADMVLSKGFMYVCRVTNLNAGVTFRAYDIPSRDMI